MQKQIKAGQWEGWALKKQTRVLLAVGVILSAVAFLIVNAFGQGKQYYLTVDEALAQGSALAGKPVRMSGALDPSTVSFDLSGPVLTFSVKGQNGGLVPIVYHGVKPDNMDMATQAIVEGRFDRSGSFLANKVMLSCPSKYQSSQTAAAVGNVPGSRTATQ